MNNNNSNVQATPALYHQIRIHGLEVRFQASETRNLLVAMEQARQSGIDVGCRGGGCGKCRVRVLDGEYVSKRMSRAWISAEEEVEGVVLACRIFARSDLLITPLPLEVPHGFQVCPEPTHSATALK